MMSQQIFNEECRVAKFLFRNPAMAWFWLIVRVYVGYEWLVAGYEKVINPVWVGSGAGGAVRGFVQGALAKTGGVHPDVQGWYAAFLQNAVLPNVRLWSHTVAIGEVLVGVGLIVGCVVGIAAFFGIFMNLNYLLAGTVSTNPVLLVLGLGLVLAWRIAGYWGLDRFVLPLFGTWRRGRVFRKSAAS